MDKCPKCGSDIKTTDIIIKKDRTTLFLKCKVCNWGKRLVTRIANVKCIARIKN